MTSDRKLFTIGADGKNLKELASSIYGPIGSPAWSPDGKLIAYSKTDVSRSTDIYLIPSTGGEEKKITFDSANEGNPRFSADGTKVYFVRREGEGGGEGRPSSQLFCVPLEKLTRDPDEPDQRPDGSAGPGQEARGGGGPGGHAQDPEDRLGRAEAAHPAGHPDGLGLQLPPGQRRPNADLRRLGRRRGRAAARAVGGRRRRRDDRRSTRSRITANG